MILTKNLWNLSMQYKFSNPSCPTYILCMYVWVSLYACPTCACVCGGQRTTSGRCCSSGAVYLYLEIDSLTWNPGLVKQVRLAVGWTPGIHLSHLHGSWIAGGHGHSLCIGFRFLNSGSHTCRGPHTTHWVVSPAPLIQLLMILPKQHQIHEYSTHCGGLSVKNVCYSHERQPHI